MLDDRVAEPITACPNYVGGQGNEGSRRALELPGKPSGLEGLACSRLAAKQSALGP